MRLLVTRPEPDAGETAERLRALGHEVMVRPMLEVRFNPPPHGPRPGSLVLTSRNAVRALARWPDATGWRNLPAFAVGAETAALLRAEGFRDVRVGEGDAEALITLIAAEEPQGLGTILYPAPRDQAADLARRLAGRGYRIERVEAYRAEPATSLGDEVIAALRGNKLDGALFFSERTAAAFVRLARAAGLEREMRRLACFALSPRTAVPLEAASCSVAVAGRPDVESLLALIPSAVRQ